MCIYRQTVSCLRRRAFCDLFSAGRDREESRRTSADGRQARRDGRRTAEECELRIHKSNKLSFSPLKYSGFSSTLLLGSRKESVVGFLNRITY
jgi:hypothetical protein